MKNDLVDFTSEDRYLVKNLYDEGYSISEIAQITHLSFYEVIFLLRRMFDSLPLDKLVPYVHIDDSTILILSDTHLGSIYENLDYIRDTYRFAKENGIHTVLHGGDLIQSTIRNVKDEYQDEVVQLEHVKRDYPFDSSINTYILLGNHDYNTFKKSDYYMDILKEREDMHFMGVKRAYVSWQEHLVSICHTTKKYHLSIPSIDNILNLKGHSHKLSYNRVKSINIPTLSDDLSLHKNAKAGFLIGKKSTHSLEIDSYYFDDTLHTEGTILKKKI